MLAQYEVPVVLCLPGVDDTCLGQVGCRTVTQKSADGEGHIGESLVQLAGCGFRAEAVATELNIQATKGDAGFIHHVGAEVMRPAGHQCLAECRDVEEVTGCAVVADVEAVAAVKDVAGSNAIAAKLKVLLDYPVEVVNRLRNCAGKRTGKRSSGAGPIQRRDTGVPFT